MPSESPLSAEITSAIAALPESLQGELEQAWSEFLNHPESSDLGQRVREATRVWAASPYVATTCRRAPGLLTGLLEAGDLDRSFADGEQYERLGRMLPDQVSESEIMSLLRQSRRKEMVRIAWRDLTGVADLQETLMDLTMLAQACVDHALHWCYRELCRRHGEPRDAQGNAQHMVVLGMGKLGGFELNYSSDIDLIFSFPGDGQTQGRRQLPNSQFFIRLGQRLIKVLNDITADGFVFRVDMRLRPFGDSGSLVSSFSALEDYYQTHGRDWERYAMIKARVVAGDFESGKSLLAILRPFVYRRYLDYGAFEALRHMKGLIDAETKRRNLENNVKLGAGGIREIEFIGQAFQLIRGGRDIELQERRIQVVLRLLGEKGLLPDYAVDKLLAAYEFLRRTENRLQMIDDQQTHNLPEKAVHRDRLAFAMGYPDWSSYKADLDAHRQRVHDLFHGISATPQFDGLMPAEEKAQGSSLLKLWHGLLDEDRAIELLSQGGYRQPAKAYAAILTHHKGRMYHLKNAIGRERLDKLMPLLIAAVGQSQDPDNVLPRLLSLIEAIVQRSVYVALLAEHPMALSQLVKLSAASPWISDYLRRHPILLDELLDPRTLYAPADRDGLTRELQSELQYVEEDDLESLMDRLRHFKQAHVLRVAAVDVMDVLPLMHVSDQLTWIAEVILKAVVKVCWRIMITKYGRPCCVRDGEVAYPGFAVAAYGKLGGIELGYGSDLDLVFLHDSEGLKQITDGRKSIANSVFYARLGQRIIQFLTALTPAGELYEVDSRLRPSGASGFLVSSLQAFRDYQLNEAWTWEHQALVRARVVAGNEGFERRFAAIRKEVLCAPRDVDTLRREVREMRKRMWEALGSGSDTLFDLKKDPGGIADIEFMVQYGILAHAHDYPALVEYTDNIRLLEGLEQNGLMSVEDARSMRDIYRSFRDKVHALSLQGEPAVVSAATLVAERGRIKALWNDIMEDR